MSTNESTTNDDDIIARGRAVWNIQKKRLGNDEQFDATWEDWFVIGEAMKVGRERCLIETGTDIYDNVYRQVYFRWLRNNGFGTFPNNLRYHIFQIMDRRDEIERYRDNLLKHSEDMKSPEKLNDPSYIIRKWRYDIEKD
jgi:hypothetical protein